MISYYQWTALFYPTVLLYSIMHLKLGNLNYLYILFNFVLYNGNKIYEKEAYKIKYSATKYIFEFNILNCKKQIYLRVLFYHISPICNIMT